MIFGTFDNKINEFWQSNSYVVSRRDFMPFGEEIASETNYRTTNRKYGTGDNIRQKFTGYEKDTETDIDFAQARYYSKNHGRFTSIDIVGPNLNNPQTLNKYRYALNNPLRYNDKNGKYEEDVHRGLTRVLAYLAGFSKKDATAIADADQGVDDDPATDPTIIFPLWERYVVRLNYHFTSEARRNTMWRQFENNANSIMRSRFGVTEQVSGMRDKALKSLGVYFHAQQDSFSHAGYTAETGHALAGHAPDKTYNDVDKANRMAKDSYDRLVKAASILNGASVVKDYNFGIGAEAPPLAYSIIEKKLDLFNRATTIEEKETLLQSMEVIIMINRIWQRQSQEVIELPQARISTNITYQPVE